MKRFHLCLLFTLTTAVAALGDTRYLVTQSMPTDCGPAALATLLHYYLDVSTSEGEMLRLSRYDFEKGTSLIGLEEAATAKGCAAGSFLMSYTTLKDQLSAFPAPMIVRTLNPMPHFSVLLALDRDYAYLADPGVGNIMLRKEAFLRQWYLPRDAQGYVLVVAAPGQHVNKDRVARTVGALRQSAHELERSRSWIAPFRR